MLHFFYKVFGSSVQHKMKLYYGLINKFFFLISGFKYICQDPWKSNFFTSLQNTVGQTFSPFHWYQDTPRRRPGPSQKLSQPQLLEVVPAYNLLPFVKIFEGLSEVQQFWYYTCRELNSHLTVLLLLPFWLVSVSLGRGTSWNGEVYLGIHIRGTRMRDAALIGVGVVCLDLGPR